MAHLVFKGLSGTLPTSVFEYQEGGKRVGLLQVRHRASHGVNVPPEMASHLYYEIDPAYRGKGYGTELFGLGLKEAKKIGLNEIIATCDEDNFASKTIIESHGGIFVEQRMNPSTGKQLLKYRFA